MGSHTHNKESTLFINHKMVSSFLKNRTENFGKWGESIKTEHTFFFDLQGLHLTHAEKTLIFWGETSDNILGILATTQNLF